MFSGQNKWFEKYCRSKEIFIAVSKSTDKPVGMIGLYSIDHIKRKAKIGCTIVGDRSLWGKGIATEMIRLLLLSRKWILK